jgi:hypothetical protein
VRQRRLQSHILKTAISLELTTTAWSRRRKKLTDKRYEWLDAALQRQAGFDQGEEIL